MKKTKITIYLAVTISIVAITLVFAVGDDPVYGSLDEFAQCLSDKGMIMYGADWCPHCQNEKKAFGDSFQLINYVECPNDPKLCLEKGIQGYPTWILPDGKKLEGEQGLERLSRESGCTLAE